MNQIMEWIYVYILIEALGCDNIFVLEFETIVVYKTLISNDVFKWEGRKIAATPKCFSKGLYFSPKEVHKSMIKIKE